MQNRQKVFWLNILSFLICLHYAVIVYSESTYLSNIFGQENIWLIYSTAAIATIFLNFLVSTFLRRTNILKITKIALVIACCNMLNLFLNHQIFSTFISFIIYITITEFLFLLTSIILEELSKDETTGNTRGTYLSIQSAGYLVAPLLSSLFVRNFGLEIIFAIGSIFLAFALIIFHNTLQKVSQGKISAQNIFLSLRNVNKNLDLRNIILTYIGLHTFYATMIIYIPFKVAGLGISLTQYLGVLLPVALLPFLFVPRILGYIEDQMRDEKEFLILGTFGLIGMLFTYAFTTSSSLLVWAILLFFGRTFASICETSINSYFFKKVDKTDTDIISIFTSSYNLVYLLFTPVFALIVKYTDIDTLFLSVSFFLTFMLVLVSKVHDTKNYEQHKTWKQIWHRAKKRTS